MWLIVSVLAAMIVTGAYLFISDKYKVSMLAIALWGLSLCIFVDHAMGYMSDPSGGFLEISTETFVLSIAMLIPIFAAWEIYVLVSKLKDKHITDCSEINVIEGV